jgi:dTDP-4-amino-4,6-dideoxygalactose transaminase
MKDYIIKDSWDWVTHFENEIAQYCGSKYAIACDSNSNAIRLLLHYLEIVDERIEIPARTYVSVPNQIILSGNKPVFKDMQWDGMYQLGYTGIYDAATAFYEGMYYDTLDESYMVLSFHIKKILNIGTGGMILTNDEIFNDWARPMIYDGRHKYKLYKEDEFECVGWHMYMSPEQAKRGLEIFHSPQIKSINQHCGGSWLYDDLSTQKIYQ